MGLFDIDFERLTANTTPDSSLIPDNEEVDRWLCDFYEANKEFEVGMFANLAAAASGTFMDCRTRECMCNTWTINADGTIGGCPNTAIKGWFMRTDGFYDKEKHKELIQRECIRNPACYTCDLFKVCNGDCHQLSWQGKTCPAPKKLIRRIIDDVAQQKGIGKSDA